MAGYCINGSKTSYQENLSCVCIYSTSGLQSPSDREEEQDCTACTSCLVCVCVCWKRLCSLFRCGSQPHGKCVWLCVPISVPIRDAYSALLLARAGDGKPPLSVFGNPWQERVSSSLPRRRGKRGSGWCC